MKKVLIFLLVGMMVFSLIGCSKPASKNDDSSKNASASNSDTTDFEKDAKLVVWESADGEGDYIKMVAKEFEAKYGIKVEYETVESVDATNKLATDGPAGVGADVFAAPHDHTGQIVSSGLALKNSNAARIRKEFMEAAVNGVSYQGDLYGYPIAIETYALYYNKDLVSKVPQTFDEIIAFAKEFNNPRENKWALMWDVGNAYFSHGFIAGYGGYVFGQGGTDKSDVGFNSQGAIDGAKFFRSLKEIFPVHSGDADYSAMDGSFSEGRAAFIINGPWAIGGYRDAGLNFGVAPLPKMPNGERPASFSGVRSLFVSSFTQYPKAAQLFADFATSKEMLLKRYEMTGQIPPHLNLVDAEQVKSDPVVLGFMEQTQYAVPMPSIPEIALMWDPYGAALATLWNETTDEKQIMDNAAKVLREAIESQGK